MRVRVYKKLMVLFSTIYTHLCLYLMFLGLCGCYSRSYECCVNIWYRFLKSALNVYILWIVDVSGVIYTHLGKYLKGVLCAC